MSIKSNLEQGKNPAQVTPTIQKTPPLPVQTKIQSSSVENKENNQVEIIKENLSKYR